MTSGRAIAGRPAGDRADKIDGYCRIRVLGKLVLAHHVAWAMVTGVWVERLDHINGNKSDNRFKNLRECTQSQNMANRGMQPNNSTGQKGVSRHPCGKYQVQLGRKYLGLVDTIEEGASLYEAAAVAKYGEFARGESFLPAIVAIPRFVPRGKHRPSADEVREVLSYDKETGEIRWLKALSFRGPIGAIAGRMNPDGYRIIGLFGKQYAAHVLAFVIVTGAWPTLVIDHIDSVRDNNIWKNLQEITQSANALKAERPSRYPQPLLSRRKR